MDQVGEFDRVLNEEDRHVVADEVPNTFGGIELHREAADVARAVGRPAGSRDGGESYEDRRLARWVGQESGPRQVGQILINSEHAVRRRAACMDDPLGYAFMIEVRDLFAEVKVLNQR